MMLVAGMFNKRVAAVQNINSTVVIINSTLDRMNKINIMLDIRPEETSYVLILRIHIRVNKVLT